MIDDEDRAEGGLFFDLETDLLSEIIRADPGRLQCQRSLANVATEETCKEFADWLELISGIWSQQQASPGDLRPSISSIASQVGLPDAIKTRKALVDTIKTQMAASHEWLRAAEWLIPAGLQILLLAYHHAPRVFRGIKGTSNFLPTATLEATIGTVRVPFGLGTVSRMTLAAMKQAAKAPAGMIGHLPDASLDPAGRVAAQDFISGNKSVIGFPLFRPGESSLEERLTGFLFFTHPLPGVFAGEFFHDVVARLRQAYSARLSSYCVLRMLMERVRESDGYQAIGHRDWVQLVIPESDWLGVRAIRSSTRLPTQLPAFGLSEGAVIDALQTRLSLLAEFETWIETWKSSIKNGLGAANGESKIPLTILSLVPSSPPARLAREYAMLAKALKPPECEHPKDVVFPVFRERCPEQRSRDCPGAIIAMIVLHWSELKEGVGVVQTGDLASSWSVLANCLRQLSAVFGGALVSAPPGFAVPKRAEDAWALIGDYLVHSCVQSMAAHAKRRESDNPALREDALDVVKIVLRNFTPKAGDLVDQLRDTSRLFSAALSSSAKERHPPSVVAFWSTRWLPPLKAAGAGQSDRYGWIARVLDGSLNLREASLNSLCQKATDGSTGSKRRVTSGAKAQKGRRFESPFWGEAKDAGANPCQRCRTPVLPLRPVSLGGVPHEVGRRVYENLSSEKERAELVALCSGRRNARRTKLWTPAGIGGTARERRQEDERQLEYVLVEGPGYGVGVSAGGTDVDVQLAAHVLNEIRRNLMDAEGAARSKERRSVKEFLARFAAIQSNKNPHEQMHENCEPEARQKIRELKAWFLGMSLDYVQQLIPNGPIAAEAFKELIGERTKLSPFGGYLLALSAYHDGGGAATGAKFNREELGTVLAQQSRFEGASLSAERHAEEMAILAEAFFEMCLQLFFLNGEDRLVDVKGEKESFAMRVKINRAKLSDRLKQLAGQDPQNKGGEASRCLWRYLGLSLVKTVDENAEGVSVLLNRSCLPFVRSEDGVGKVTCFEWVKGR